MEPGEEVQRPHYNRASFHSLTHQVVTKDLQGPGPMLRWCGTRVWECLTGIYVCTATTGDNLRTQPVSSLYCLLAETATTASGGN